VSQKSENTRDRITHAAEELIMAKGFAGTSIDDILKSAGLTKGAFFHHFKGKGDLARVLVENHARRDIEMFEGFVVSAEKEIDDPLEQIFLVLEAFEKMVSGLGEQPPGCIYAVYTYESMQFEPAIRDFVADTLRRWTSIYTRKFHEVLDRYPPALPVTARELAEMVIAVIEGGFVLARAYGDGRLTARQTEQVRNYLGLLFGGRPSKTGKRIRKSVERRGTAEEYV
jgi:TetR/AcrR family transcriptional regulator, transcriptional repressor for nem operon